MEQIALIFGIRKENRLGFTLIELLIVIAIIGIIAGIGIPMFLGQRTKAIRSEAKTNLQVIFTLQEQFYAEYGRYAPWPDKDNPASKGQARYKVGDTSLSDIFPQFRPGDPSTLNFDYIISSLNSGTNYFIYAKGKSGKGGEGIKIQLNEENEWGTFEW